MSTTSKAMTTTIRLSPGAMYQNGKESYIKHWHKPLPKTTKEETQDKEDKEDKEKRVIVYLKPNKTDFNNGKFGFDEYDDDFEKTCTKGLENLKKEYKPLNVYGQEYYPSWISMRKGQTITLKIDNTKTKKYKLFEEINIEEHPDFTFEPTNLKDAKEVQITCNNTGSEVQLKIEGDGETVGGINIFYPASKEVKVRWIIVNFNEGDEKSIKGQISYEKLKSYFKKAFNPALINVEIVNADAEILDLTTPIENASEKEYINKIKKNMHPDKSNFVKEEETYRVHLLSELNALYRARVKPQRNDEIYLYLTNCKSQWNNKKNPELIEFNNGITIDNLSLMFLANDREYMQPSVEIPHEIMHAMGLEHTFKEGEKYIFKESKTNNYMDYNNTKETLFYWQWNLLH